MTTMQHPISLPDSTPNLLALKTRWKQQLGQLNALIDEGLIPPAFAQEIVLLSQSIEDFKLAVPLIGKFSTGKSSLINAWLGQEVQAIDLGPCTYNATEFHYAEQPRLVVHWSQPDGNARIEQRPISDYTALKAGQFGKPEKLQLVELHLNNPALARFPEIMLVDTPGISAHDTRHTEATASYLGDGVVFILCANESTLGQEELAIVQRQRSLGQAFYLLQCKQDLLAPSDRADVFQTLIRQAGLDPSRARSCSAREGALEGLEEILQTIETEKTQLFIHRFGPLLENLVAQAQRLLQRQLEQDVTADQLQAQQQALRQGMEGAQRAFQNESDHLIADVRGPVTRAVREAVNIYLRSRTQDYAHALLHNQDPSAMVAADTRNAVQLAAEDHLAPRLEQAAQRIGTEIQRATTVLDIGDLSLGAMPLNQQATDENSNQLFNAGSLLSMASLVITKFPIHPILAILGTMIKLIGPVLGAFFNQQKQKENQRAQAEGQIGLAINQVMVELDRQLPAALQEQSRIFIEKLRIQFDARLSTDQQSLYRLQADLQQNKQARDAKEAQVKQALATLQTLAINKHQKEQQQ